MILLQLQGEKLLFEIFFDLLNMISLFLSGPTSDLFSEIHLNELQKLEKLLETSECEKGQLTSVLKDQRDHFDKLKGDLTTYKVNFPYLHPRSLKLKN